MHQKTLLASLIFTLGMTPAFASSHREAPITALDQKADITDWYAFVDPAHPDRVVMILNVDPFLEPSNGPNYFPFDPGILYEMKIDNNHDGVEEVKFQFRFKTEIRAPGVFTGFVGGILGVKYGTRIGDGVNVATTPITTAFPYIAPAYNGRNSVHMGPGQLGCAPGGAGTCPTN